MALPKNCVNFRLLFEVSILLCAVFSHSQLRLSRSFVLNFSVMNQIKLNVVSREVTGRGAVRRLRAAGKIPASVYSKGTARSVTVNAVEFRNLNRELGGEASLIELTDENGESMLTLINDVQHHAIKGSINHIDFQEVKRGESFVTSVPTHLANEAACDGVKNEGGIIDHKSHEVEIRCRPSKLPDHIPVDVAALKVGEAIHISDLPVIEGVEYLGNPIQVIVSCQPPTVAAAEPEVAEEVDAASVPADNIKEEAAEEGADA
jgi:large subunit ribosomal protein L25